MIEQYVHHGAAVSVRSDLKGEHREYCLCNTPCARRSLQVMSQQVNHEQT